MFINHESLNFMPMWQRQALQKCLAALKYGQSVKFETYGVNNLLSQTNSVVFKPVSLNTDMTYLFQKEVVDVVLPYVTSKEWFMTIKDPE